MRVVCRIRERVPVLVLVPGTSTVSGDEERERDCERVVWDLVL